MGWAFFPLVLVVQPEICFRRPPAAFWCFLAYFAVFYINGYLQGGEIVEAGGRAYPQLLIMFWMSYNLLRYQKVFFSTLGMFALSVVFFAALQLVGFDTYEISGRVSALEENLNSAATVLALGLVSALGIAYGQRQGGRFAKVAAWVAFAMMGLAVVRTGSRGGLLSLAIGIGVFVLRKGSAWIRFRNAVIVFLGLVVLIVLASTLEVSRERWERTFAERNIGLRQKIYPTAWKMFLEKPIRGWGAGLMVAELGARTGRERRDTHNLYLWVLTEDGLLGAIPFLLGIWLCVRAAWRGRKLLYGVVPLAFLSVDLVANMAVSWGGSKAPLVCPGTRPRRREAAHAIGPYATDRRVGAASGNSGVSGAGDPAIRGTRPCLMRPEWRSSSARIRPTELSSAASFTARWPRRSFGPAPRSRSSPRYQGFRGSSTGLNRRWADYSRDSGTLRAQRSPGPSVEVLAGSERDLPGDRAPRARALPGALSRAKAGRHPRPLRLSVRPRGGDGRGEVECSRGADAARK